MNYDEITEITAERISDYMTEAVNTNSKAVAEMFHNAAWGVRTLWFELVTKIDMDIHKENRYASYDLRRKIEMQHEEFQKMTEREQVPLLKSPERCSAASLGYFISPLLYLAGHCINVTLLYTFISGPHGPLARIKIIFPVHQPASCSPFLLSGYRCMTT